MVMVERLYLNTLCLCAFRYALGRKTYIVDDVATIIKEYYEKLTPHTVELICKEIREAIDTNNYGMEMDKETWQTVLGNLEAIKAGKNLMDIKCDHDWQKLSDFVQLCSKCQKAVHTLHLKQIGKKEFEEMYPDPRCDDDNEKTDMQAVS